MNKVKMTMTIAAATLVCAGAFAEEGGGGKETIPTKVVAVQEGGNDSLLVKWVNFLLATDRGG